MQNLKIKYRKPKLLAALGEAPGATIRANTALIAARKALALLSMGLITASVRAEQD
jgi:hypothetical protein